VKIRELTLHQFRGFDQPEPFTFSERFTVIAGVNGRGKTSLLDALALAMSRLLPQIAPLVRGFRPFAAQDIKLGSDRASVALKANCASYPVDFRVEMIAGKGRVKPKRLPSQLRKAIQAAYGPDKSRSTDAAPLAVYFTTDRAWFRRPKNLPAHLPTNQGLAFEGALINRTINYRDFMARLRVSIETADGKEDNKHYLGDRALEAMQQALKTFLGDFHSLRVETEPLRLKVRKGEDELDVNQLSDGERSFLAMVADLVRRLTLANPGLKNPLEGEGVVLIDELELHLHPQWQLEVVDKLKDTFPNVQFICTTHSPFIVQTLEPGQLIILDDIIPQDYSNKGLEEVARKVMDIKDPTVTPRYLKMLDAARRYFTLLKSAPSLKNQTERERLKRELDDIASPWASNPAYQAFLEVQRTAAFKE
jgi:predicted ATP-binding protein involved in virulence